MAKFDIKLSDIGFSSRLGSNFSTQAVYNPRLNLVNKSEGYIKNITRNIDKAMIRSILQISDTIERNLALAITSSIWSTNDGLDDIYLTGNLLSSGNVLINGSDISIRYDVPYASLIYYGGYIVPYGSRNVEKVYIPPRPWIRAVLDGTNGLPQINYGDIILQAVSDII